jgi:hypothetical protein
MKTVRWLAYFLLFLPVIAFSQADKSDADDNFDDANYEVALKQYIKVYRKYKDDPQVNHRLAICILNTNEDKTLALPYLKIADSIAKTPIPTMKYDMARAMYYSQKFDEAETMAREYLLQKITPEQRIECDRLLDYIRNARKHYAKPKNVTFENLGDKVNSKQDDYIPIITEDEQQLYFTTNRKYNNEYQQFIKGVFYSQKEASRQWGASKSAGSKINSDEHEQLVGIAKDGNTLLVHVDRLSAPNDIYISEKGKTSFSELTPLPKNINSKYAEMGASLSKTGDTLFFASDRPGGFGGYDIYLTKKLPTGGWGMPQNLGETINTPHDENFPYITASGERLYFTSNGSGSMGGCDVFFSENLDEGLWASPVNLGYPINDMYDNFNIVYTANGRYGYTSRYDASGVGGLDICRIIMNDIPPTEVVHTGQILLSSGDKKVPVHEKPGIMTSVEIKVVNNKTGKETGIIPVNAKTSKYTFAISPGNYTLTVKGKGTSVFTKEIFIADEQPPEPVINLDIILTLN